MTEEVHLSPAAAYGAVIAAFSIGTLASLGLNYDFRLSAFMQLGWCALMSVWFPFVVLAGLRKFEVERAVLAASILSMIAGFGLYSRMSAGC